MRKKIDRFLIIDHQLVAVLLCLTYLVDISVLSTFHKIGTYGTETDFYGGYAVEAQRIWQGKEYEYAWHGPGYPLLLGLINLAFHDIFLSAKILSIISAAFVLFIGFKLFATLFNSQFALLTLPILMVNALFVRLSLSATTDMVFYLFSVAALYLIFHGPASYLKFTLTGGVAGLAYIIRTNGIFIPIGVVVSVFLLNYLRGSIKKRTYLVLAFFLGFLVVTLPVLKKNYQRHHNPFYNVTYIAVAADYYGVKGPRGLSVEGFQDVEGRFNSIREIIRLDPWHFIKHFIRNTTVFLGKTVYQLVRFPLNIFLFLV
ncbi:MAG: glycosyltransferase family 39 protein [Acidobacteria bacterium]|nr:glycosyltransferase family 39 protein [Acidobacteriota bacterium]